jgi:hypothetical protein
MLTDLGPRRFMKRSETLEADREVWASRAQGQPLKAVRGAIPWAFPCGGVARMCC